MEITDYTKRFDRTNCNVNHAQFFPYSIFVILAETHLLLNFFVKDEILDYSSVNVYQWCVQDLFCQDQDQDQDQR